MQVSQRSKSARTAHLYLIPTTGPPQPLQKTSGCSIGYLVIVYRVMFHAEKQIVMGFLVVLF